MTSDLTPGTGIVDLEFEDDTGAIEEIELERPPADVLHKDM